MILKIWDEVKDKEDKIWKNDDKSLAIEFFFEDFIMKKIHILNFKTGEIRCIYITKSFESACEKAARIINKMKKEM